MNKPDMRDYVDVATRIASFKEKHPDGSLQSEIVELSDRRVVVKAYAYRDKDDTRPGTGHAAERIPGSTPFTAGSELMVCETSAWGRAIAALGFEVKKGVATVEEVQAAQSRAAAPAQRSDDEELVNVWKDDTETVVIKDAPDYEFTAKLAAAATASGAGLCPRHSRPWAWREGVARATGKEYAFWSCDAPKGPEGYCSEKPSREWVRAQGRG
jgi:hypothetical protein